MPLRTPRPVSDKVLRGNARHVACSNASRNRAGQPKEYRMQRTRLALAVAAATVALAAPAVQAQEANVWDVVDLTGRDETTSIAQRSRQDVLAELQLARADGSYHAGNEGPTPDFVIERRIMAAQREAERIARAYRDEQARLARANAQEVALAPSRAEPAPAMPVTPVESVIIVPVQPATLPSDTITAQPSVPGNTETPQPAPEAQPTDMAADRRTPAEAAAATPPGAPADASAEPGGAVAGPASGSETREATSPPAQ
jgi:hypothetical protein